MAPYFDWTDDNDLALLRKKSRESEDLETLAPQVEADVIEYYTTAVDPLLRGWYASPYRAATQIETGSNRWVFLRGYTLDAADPTCDPALKLAMKRTIATVIEWRLAQQHKDPLVQTAAGQQAATTTYRPDANDPFPLNWDRWLASFNTREIW